MKLQYQKEVITENILHADLFDTLVIYPSVLYSQTRWHEDHYDFNLIGICSLIAGTDFLYGAASITFG
jgi:hypothetical protein